MPEPILCPLRTSSYQPGCSTVAVLSRAFRRAGNEAADVGQGVYEVIVGRTEEGRYQQEARPQRLEVNREFAPLESVGRREQVQPHHRDGEAKDGPQCPYPGVQVSFLGPISRLR